MRFAGTQLSNFLGDTTDFTQIGNGFNRSTWLRTQSRNAR